MSKTRKWYAKGLYLVFALALVVGLAGIVAVPMTLADPGSAGYTLSAPGADATATWETEKNTSATTGYVAALGSYSVKVKQGSTYSDTRVGFTPGALTLADLPTIGATSFYYNIEAAAVGANLYLDFDFSDPSSAGFVDVFLQFHHATETPVVYDGNWNKLTVNASDLNVNYGGNDPGGSGFSLTPPLLSLATVLSDVSKGLDKVADDYESGSDWHDWKLTSVRAGFYDATAGNVCYIDNITFNGTLYELEPIKFVNASDTEIHTVPSAGSFYLMLDSVGPWWNASEFVEDTGQVTLKVYDGLTTPTLLSTNAYTMTESGKNTGRFRTGVISGADLSLKPGYKLVGDVSGASSNTAYAAAKVSFDKTIYSIDEEMTLTVEDDSENTSATGKQTINSSSCSAITNLDIGEKGEATDTDLDLVETGNDTGIFQVKKTPRNADAKIWCNSAMDFRYKNTNTTVGAGSDIITKTAYVSPTSPSSTAFSPATIAVTATNVSVVVIDRDKSDEGDPTVDGDTISGAVVVKSLAADDSVIDSLTVATLIEFDQAGKFHATVTFGTGATQLDKTGAATLQAIYTDPNDLSDVSTGTAPIGTTVDLYKADDTLYHSYTKIQTAIDAVTGTGWTVKVSEAYNSTDETFPITINEVGLKVESIGEAANTVIDASKETVAGAVEITAADVTFDGFTVKSGAKGIKTTANGTIIQNNIVTKETGAVVMGIEVSGTTTGVTVSGNELDIRNTIYLANTPSTCKLSANTFGAGINLAGIQTDITITGNTIIGSELTGIDFDSGGDFTTILIQGNTISETTLAPAIGIRVRGTISGAAGKGVIIVGNDIKDNDGYPVSVAGTGNADKVDLVFNNITGNAKGVNNSDTTKALNAKHNWWGTATGPVATDTTGAGTTTTTYYLTAPVKLTAEYTEAAGGSFDKHLTTGVSVAAAGGDLADANVIGVAEYTESPKAAMADASFYDAFVTGLAGAYTPGATSTVTVCFYTSGASDDSVPYFWNKTGGTWDACSNYGYNSYDEYIWVLAKDQTVTVPTYPTIQELTGSMFAISGVPVKVLESIDAAPSSVSLDVVGDTQAITVTATYDDASTAVVTATSTYVSDAESVATVSAAGVITAVAEGSAIITVSYTEGAVTKTDTVSVTVGWNALDAYDENGDGVISKAEAVNAVQDYFNGLITKAQAIEVVTLYFA